MKKGIITQEKRVTWETQMINNNSNRSLDQYNQSNESDDIQRLHILFRFAAIEIVGPWHFNSLPALEELLELSCTDEKEILNGNAQWSHQKYQAVSEQVSSRVVSITCNSRFNELESNDRRDRQHDQTGETKTSPVQQTVFRIRSEEVEQHSIATDDHLHRTETVLQQNTVFGHCKSIKKSGESVNGVSNG